MDQLFGREIRVLLLSKIIKRLSSLRRKLLFSIPVQIRIGMSIGSIILMVLGFWLVDWYGSSFLVLLPFSFVIWTAPVLFFLEIQDRNKHRYHMANSVLLVCFIFVSLSYLVLLFFKVLEGDWQDYLHASFSALMSYLLARLEFQTACFLAENNEDSASLEK